MVQWSGLFGSGSLIRYHRLVVVEAEVLAGTPISDYLYLKMFRDGKSWTHVLTQTNPGANKRSDELVRAPKSSQELPTVRGASGLLDQRVAVSITGSVLVSRYHASTV